jgi:hypothetical protein
MKRAFTPEEANRLLPQVESGLERVKGILERLRSVRDQLTDLRIIWGPKIEEPECTDRDEYQAYLGEFQLLEAQLRSQLEALQGIGCEVKDPDVGLVDFYTEHDGAPAYLCWKKGEDGIRFWHTLEAGFAGRKPHNSS